MKHTSLHCPPASGATRLTISRFSLFLSWYWLTVRNNLLVCTSPFLVDCLTQYKAGFIVTQRGISDTYLWQSFIMIGTICTQHKTSQTQCFDLLLHLRTGWSALCTAVALFLSLSLSHTQTHWPTCDSQTGYWKHWEKSCPHRWPAKTSITCLPTSAGRQTSS